VIIVLAMITACLSFLRDGRRKNFIYFSLPKIFRECRRTT